MVLIPCGISLFWHFGRIICLHLQGDWFWIRWTQAEVVLLRYGVMHS